MRVMRFVLALLAVGLLAFLAARWLPPAWDPRAPLDLMAEPNALTPWKLGRLRNDPAACLAVFAASGLSVRRVPDRAIHDGCGFEGAMLLPTALRALPNTPIVSCPVAAAWVLFERHGLQPAARERLGSEVAGVRHLGTYNCRNVYHAASGRRSEHATANAIDIAGFVLRDGRELTLLRDWPRETGEAGFLRAARDGACRWFRAVLGPEYNAAHRDHFHLDMGRWRACR